MVGSSEIDDDRWLPFMVSLRISKRERVMVVYGYNAFSPGSVNKAIFSEECEENFFELMEKQFAEFRKWADIEIIIGDEKKTYPRIK